ncbi:MAG: hypothetical protein IT337_07335 [Thermomicrobiales bacterium]|nr:hypothetical protein [Thermomicrobiales bacterium]
MTAEVEPAAGPRPGPCSYHPNVETLLRCSRCGKPICPQCGVRTPVGLRCPDCAGVAGLVGPMGGVRTLQALAHGLLVTVPVGVVWAFFPDWAFYLALVMGFAGAEAVARAVPGRRGPELQAIAVVVVLVGLALSRLVLLTRLGVDLADIGRIDFAAPRVQRALHLQPIPDLIFAALPIVIAFFRFR